MVGSMGEEKKLEKRKKKGWMWQMEREEGRVGM